MVPVTVKENKMRNLLVIVLLVCVCVGAYAGTREAMYRQFGPILLEAVVRVVKDEINILRAQHGLSARTDQQLINALETKMAELPKYAWMTDPNNI